MEKPKRRRKQKRKKQQKKSREPFIYKPQVEEAFEAISMKRVGIRVCVDKPRRFYTKNNNFIARK